MSALTPEIKRALTADENELRILINHHSVEILKNIFLNKNLNEDHVYIIANRKNIPSSILEQIFNNNKWKESYKIILALCRNPRTPEKITMQTLKSLRILDLAELTRNKQVRISIRSKAELMICEKILSLPSGIKISIARKASSNVLVKLIEDGLKEVVAVCLDNPLLTEGDICKILHLRKTTSSVINMIARHPKWSSRYEIQKALIRNNMSPLSIIVNYFDKILIQDLKDLYEDPDVPISTKPFLYRELFRRNAIDIEK